MYNVNNTGTKKVSMFEYMELYVYFALHLNDVIFSQVQPQFPLYHFDIDVN